MAGFPSEYLADALLNYLFRAVSFTPPATWYCALYTVAPTEAGGGTEVTGGSYARVGKTRGTTDFTAASSQVTRNATAITFPSPTADWGTVVGAGWFDAASSGNLLMYGPLSQEREILNGDAAPVILANGGTFTIEGLTD